MKRSNNEKGTALVFAMIFVLVLSIMAVSLTFLSQSETWSSLNYRLMTQARYGAETGIHSAANYIINKYTSPSAVNAADPITAYSTTVRPVTANGKPVVLGAAFNGLSANYPISSIASDFSNKVQGSVTAGNNTLNYSASAQLLSMRQINECGVSGTAQTWLLTSRGDVSAVRNAEVEVSAILEQQVAPCYNYAAFATANGCSAINFTGNGVVKSYDSSGVTGFGTSGVSVTPDAYDGNLGANGNLNTANNTVVSGTFSSPRTGVGSCAVGAPDALSGGGTVTGCETSGQTNCGASCTSNCAAKVLTLSQQVQYNPPTTDYPTCSGATAATCDAAILTAMPPANKNPSGTINPGNYGDISLSGNSTITLNPSTAGGTCSTGVYYFESISKMTGNASLSVAPCPGTNPPVYQPVIINIVGVDGSGNQVNPVINLAGNGLSNLSMDASIMQIQYGGTGAVNLVGNGTGAAVLFAPKAPVSLSGNGAWYGSLIGKSVSSNGNGGLFYDRRLSNELFIVTNWTLDSFTWSKF
jgi:hypothetical protein